MASIRKKVKDSSLIRRPVPEKKDMDDDLKEARKKIGLIQRPPEHFVDRHVRERREQELKIQQARRETKERIRKAEAQNAKEAAYEAAADTSAGVGSSVSQLIGCKFGAGGASGAEDRGRDTTVEERAAPQKHRPEKGTLADDLFGDEDEDEDLEFDDF
jgi:hypothetical protein